MKVTKHQLERFPEHLKPPPSVTDKKTESKLNTGSKQLTGAAPSNAAIVESKHTVQSSSVDPPMSTLSSDVNL
ncbi:hypothetical protein PoB_006786600 [Plakobranchus ocellatus]|uniref:Uncharacterized protein n=1 Tax=Plakobranchus ocellatus TaxID=259542 RepID=A0AAV4DBB3_9GAST|nr:hypothetical protein PoB_006786600 [Plakobranchus ocellatus]